MILVSQRILMKLMVMQFQHTVCTNRVNLIQSVIVCFGDTLMHILNQSLDFDRMARCCVLEPPVIHHVSSAPAVISANGDAASRATTDDKDPERGALLGSIRTFSKNQLRRSNTVDKSMPKLQSDASRREVLGCHWAYNSSVKEDFSGLVMYTALVFLACM